jgi:DeoR family transcriptional regulator, deoxyribose operon repressor
MEPAKRTASAGRPRRGERLDRLYKAILARGVMRLREAASLLGTSEMTVRRDIATDGNRFVYLGGYIVANEENASSQRPYVFVREAHANAAGKRAACARAVQLIEPQDTIFLDCGTTLPYLADMLPSQGKLTVVCYSLNIAEIVCRRTAATVLLLGGEYRSSSDSFACPEGLAMLERVGVTKGFFSAGGLHLTRGVSCSNFHEVAIKQAAMRSSLHRYVVADSNKFGEVRPAFFASLSEFDGIVTDPNLPAEELEAFTAAGVPVLTASREDAFLA